MIRVITGHICSGKSTHVDLHARRGDVVIDLDRLAVALSAAGAVHHQYPQHVRDVARAARYRAIEESVRLHRVGGFDVWIVHAYPEPRDLATYSRIGADVVELRVDAATLRDRAARHRPPDARECLEHRLACETTSAGGFFPVRHAT